MYKNICVVIKQDWHGSKPLKDNVKVKTKVILSLRAFL